MFFYLIYILKKKIPKTIGYMAYSVTEKSSLFLIKFSKGGINFIKISFNYNMFERPIYLS